MKPTGWRATGVCPACKRRTVTVGRCIQCGWESEELQLRNKQLVLKREEERERWRREADKC